MYPKLCIKEKGDEVMGLIQPNCEIRRHEATVQIQQNPGTTAIVFQDLLITTIRQWLTFFSREEYLQVMYRLKCL